MIRLWLLCWCQLGPGCVNTEVTILRFRAHRSGADTCSVVALQVRLSLVCVPSSWGNFHFLSHCLQAYAEKNAVLPSKNCLCNVTCIIFWAVKSGSKTFICLLKNLLAALEVAQSMGEMWKTTSKRLKKMLIFKKKPAVLKTLISNSVCLCSILYCR